MIYYKTIINIIFIKYLKTNNLKLKNFYIKINIKIIK